MAEFETKAHRITKSNTHDGMWIFSSKKDNTFFAITASRDWIADNSEIMRYPQVRKVRRFRRSRR